MRRHDSKLKIGRTRRRWVGLVAGALLLAATPADSQRAREDAPLSLKFDNAPVDMVLSDYSQKTGRTILKSPKVPAATISLRSQGGLDLDDYLQAIETVLAMHGIGLVRTGERFVKVVPIAEARMEAMHIGQQEFRSDAGEGTADADGETAKEPVLLPETGELRSHLISLRYIGLEEARKAAEPFKHAYGQIHAFESINSLLVTDKAANINRIMEVLRFIDQPVVAREEPHVIDIKFSKASEIKAKLEEIIAESEARKQRTTLPRQRTSGSPGVESAPRPSTPPGVIRARAAQPAAAAESVDELALAEAERGIIRGEVKIVADDRTNVLIIITRPENMTFFERIVNVLDVETAPDVTVRVFRLEFANAKDITAMLNDLIGAAAEGDGPTVANRGADGESVRLREIATRRTAEPSAETKSKIGQLSKDDIKILADERTNALVIMASRGDLATLEEIITDMDIMLSQVLVEAVVLEINLDGTFQSGFDWLQRSLVAYKNEASGNRRPVTAFAGSGGGGDIQPSDSLSFTSPGRFPTVDGDPLAGLTYYLTYFDLNLDVVFRMVSTDSRTRILSSPVILTTDNKTATIDVSTERYFYKGKKYVGGGDNPFYEDDVETKKVGITLSVTPRINEKRYVVMELTQQIDNVSGVQIINGTEWPIVTTRKLEAEVAVRSGDTIVLGGLVLNNTVKKRSKIPFLADIPVLGWPFRSQRDEDTQNEVIVFITPYVMSTPEEIEAEAIRRRDALSLEDMWQRGWTDSRLASPSQAERREAALRARGTPAAPIPASALSREVEDPLAGLTPEEAAFIRSENRRWDERLEAVDREIEVEIGR